MLEIAESLSSLRHKVKLSQRALAAAVGHRKF
jgi:hypothetical protein